LGKSLFVNRLLTALNTHIQTGAVFGGGADHTTQEIQSFNFPQKQLTVSLWDTWGLDENNYSDKILLNILSGKVPDGYKRSQDDNRDKIAYQSDPVEEWSRRVHALLMFIPVGILSTPNLLERMKQNFSLAGKLNIQPLIIVTRMDTIPEKERPILPKFLSEKWNLPPAAFYFIKNYTDEKQKDFDMDKTSLQILKLALQRAKDHIGYHLVKEAKKMNWNGPRPTETPQYSTSSSEIKSSISSPEKGAKKCPDCSFTAASGFCPTHGKEVKEPPQPKVATGQLVCPVCNEPGEGKFCPTHGAERVVKQTRQCPTCGTPAAPGQLFCAKDGQKIDGPKKCGSCSTVVGDGPFCPSCGTKQ